MASTPPPAGTTPASEEHAAGVASARAIIAEALAPAVPDGVGGNDAPSTARSPNPPGGRGASPPSSETVGPDPHDHDPEGRRATVDAGRMALFERQRPPGDVPGQTSDAQLAAALRVLAAGAEDLPHAGDALGMRALMASAAERISRATAANGERSEQIVRLAYEEAAKIVQQAEADAARLRADAQAAMADVLDALQMVDAAHARLGHALESLGGQVHAGPHPSTLAEETASDG